MSWIVVRCLAANVVVGVVVVERMANASADDQTAAATVKVEEG